MFLLKENTFSQEGEEKSSLSTAFVKKISEQKAKPQKKKNREKVKGKNILG